MMNKICDWSKEKAEKERDIVQAEYNNLLSKSLMELSLQEKQRKSNLNLKLKLLNALHFGNPDGEVICKKCNNKFVAGYIGNGVYLNESCISCYRNIESKNFFTSRKVHSLGKKHGAST